MAAIDKKTYAASKKYTDKEIAGGGAIKGKNCTIDSIVPITGGSRVTFKWTLDDGTVQTGTMDVMDGAPGATGAQGPQGPTGPAGADGADGLGINSVDIDTNNHLIITYDDGTKHDAGEIPGGGGDVISVNGKKGTVILYATDIKMSNDPSAKTIALTIDELQGSMSSKANQSDVTQIQLDVSALQGSLANKVDKEAGKGLSEENYTAADMQKLQAMLAIKTAGSGLNFDPTTGELTATGAAITIDPTLDENSANAIQNKAVAVPIHMLQGSMLTVQLDVSQLQGSMSNKVDKEAGKGLSEENFSTANKTALETTIPLNISQLQGSLSNKIDSTEKGSANGVAPLGSDSKVPAANLPSYVDDIEEYASKSAFPATGESGKIYVDLSDNKTYRWSGSTYVIVGNDLALGETSSTAYSGDKGKANADNITRIQLDITALQGSMSGKADKSDTYTKAQVDTALGNKADKSDTYTKAQVDTALGNKADKTDTYTKTQVDTALAAKANTSDLDEWVGTATVDADGDITFDNLDDTKNYDVPYFQNKFVKITGMTKGTGTTSGTIKLTYHTDATNGTSGKLREIK